MAVQLTDTPVMHLSRHFRRRSVRRDGRWCVTEFLFYAGMILGCCGCAFVFYKFRENIIVLRLFVPSDGQLQYVHHKAGQGVSIRKQWIINASGTDCTKKSRPEIYKSLPLVNLLSAQGSGQTWLRFLIERMTGICTASLYGDYRLQAAGFVCETYGPTMHKRAIVVRSHYYHQLEASSALLLVRNPFHAVVADFNRETSSGDHTGYAGIESFYTKEWKHFVQERTKEWLQLITATLTKATDVHVVFYENLKDSLESELKRIADFLRVHVPDERLNCTLHNAMGPARRPARVLPDDIFTEIARKHVNNAVCAAYKALSDYGVVNFPKFYFESCS